VRCRARAASKLACHIPCVLAIARGRAGLKGQGADTPACVRRGTRLFGLVRGSSILTSTSLRSTCGTGVWSPRPGPEIFPAAKLREHARAVVLPSIGYGLLSGGFRQWLQSLGEHADSPSGGCCWLHIR
jgi:hypothetical protein